MATSALHHFPAIGFDETFHSMVARWHRLSGNRFSRQTLDDVFGTHLVVATSFFPSHLGDLFKRLPHTTDYALERLIESTTLLPYFRPFLTSAQTRLCHEAMMGRSAGGAKVGIGTVASGVGGRNYFRFCEQCRREDEATVGCAYWHRSHCLPGVLICHRHHCVLFELPAVQVEAMRHSLFLPDEFDIDQCSSQQAISGWGEQLWLAQSSHSLLFAQLPPISRVSLQGLYRRRAQDWQLIDVHGRLNVSRILFSAGRLRAAFRGNDDMAFLRNENWPLRLLRKQRASAHPVKHLALMQLLDTTVDQLRDASPVGSAKAPLAKRSLETPVAPPQERGGRRERFLAAALVQNNLRKVPDYIWLYRHDRQWLNEVLAKHKSGIARSSERTDWTSRDALLAQQIIDITRKLREADDPHRLSAAHLAGQTGKRATIEKFPAKLPLTSAALQVCAESIDSYRCRRVRAVVLRMREAGIPLVRWRVLRQAGLREPLSKPVEEALQMYLGNAA
jgi:hypothetical protein